MNRADKRRLAKQHHKHGPAIGRQATVGSGNALQVGLSHHRAGRLDRAEPIYRQILKTQPDHAEANHLLGALAYQAGNPLAAIGLVEKALRADGRRSEYHNTLGEALTASGRLEEAAASYRRAIDIYPGLDAAHSNLGNALLALGNTNEAIASYRQALKLTPGLARTHYNLAKALSKQFRLAEAAECYRQAIKHDPRLVDAYSNLGNILTQLGQDDEAIEHHNQARGIAPNSPSVHYNLGKTFQDLGRLDEAIASYRSAVAIDSGFTEAHYNLGNALEAQGSKLEALESFQQAMKTRANFSEAAGTDIAPATRMFMLELTNKCNFHCEFCPSDQQTRPIGFMTLDSARNILDEFAEKHVAKTVFLHLMGEPTLHPRLHDILGHAASLKLDVDMVTNGSTLNPKTIPALLESLRGGITVSLQTPSRESFSLRGKVGITWDRYIKNIKLLVKEYLKRLKENRSPVNRINIRVMKTAETDVRVDIIEDTEQAMTVLSEWRRFVSELETEFGLSPFPRRDILPDDLINFPGERFSYHLQQGITLDYWKAFTFANTRVDDTYELEIKKEHIFCSKPFYHLGVLWNGDVTLCCMDYDSNLVVGNVRDSSLESVLFGEGAEKLRATMLGEYTPCEFCQRCQADIIKG